MDQEHENPLPSIANLDGPSARALRESLGLAGREFYASIGVNQTSQSRWERGLRGLRPETHRRIQAHFAEIIRQHEREELIRALGLDCLRKLEEQQESNS